MTFYKFFKVLCRFWFGLLLKSNQTVYALDRLDVRTKSPRRYATLHFASCAEKFYICRG